MDKLAAPILLLLQSESRACAIDGAWESCPELPEWAPPQKTCPKAPLAHPLNDHYESWQDIAW